MNPHFMYNALNSIQALILKKDIKNSNLYLSQFSRLMRKVLEISGKLEISIQEEVETLELYLSLEQLRFGAEFNYEIIVQKDLDAYSCYIPPLLLQPFVENAIKHGLLHKKGDKKLTISFQKEHDTLVCMIKDNGIGRVHAQEIKDRQREAHHSFSTSATQKRIELLNNVNGKNLALELIDLYENDEPSGTLVIMKIPI
jgi:LytS/YehU family sensor histidine kinase